jgi:hypothetical protein
LLYGGLSIIEISQQKSTVPEPKRRRFWLQFYRSLVTGIRGREVVFNNTKKCLDSVHLIKFWG